MARAAPCTPLKVGVIWPDARAAGAVSEGSRCFGLGRAGSAGVGNDGKDGKKGRRTVIKWQNFLSAIVAGFHETCQTKSSHHSNALAGTNSFLAFVLSFGHVLFDRSQGKG